MPSPRPAQPRRYLAIIRLPPCFLPLGEGYTRSKNVEVTKYKQSVALSLPNHVSRHFQKEILRYFHFLVGTLSFMSVPLKMPIFREKPTFFRVLLHIR